MLLVGLSWAGFTLDEAANRTAAWVIPINEELVIARQTRGVLGAMQAELAS
jgi:acetate kinase